jgi:hypothetical protein
MTMNNLSLHFFLTTVKGGHRKLSCGVMNERVGRLREGWRVLIGGSRREKRRGRRGRGRKQRRRRRGSRREKRRR